MDWFWYVARNNELMVDCDGVQLLEIAQKRLARSGLPVDTSVIFPSQNESHFHLVIKLTEPMNAIERQVWQLFLMDHVYRSVNNLFRALNGTPSPCLLISPRYWDRFWRAPDAICHCEMKHKGPTLSGCEVGARLRGNSEAAQNFQLGTNL